uniref:putative disease resistance RPP13-like protein 1 n=1 Tax=Erigeron canadensis TaxID=72917 RepID=UPI001CB99E64|nr:putative disease resistance RPP13-like protein 1 [Erigeron canadensis]
MCLINLKSKDLKQRSWICLIKPHSDNLKLLEVVSYGGTKFPKWVTDSSFIMLTSVSIHKCRNCKFLPPLGHMSSLKKLFIESMDDVKEVGLELLGNGPTTFPSLEILRFKNMPQWEVWSVNVGVVVFPCLKELHIEECPNMARWEVRSANGDEIVFSCLQELLVNRCPNLVKVSLKALPSLRNLKVWNCGGVLLTSLVGLASSITKLSIIHILGLRDKMWGSVVEYLGALEELRISGCEKLRNLWEASEACKEILMNLKKLKVWYCGKLVKIGGEKEEGEGSNLPFLTSLKMIKIWRCKNLKHLSCPGNIETLDI